MAYFLVLVVALPVLPGGVGLQNAIGQTTTQGPERPLGLEERALVEVLEQIRSGVRSGIDFEQFSDLVVEAQARLEMLQKASRGDDPFLHWVSEVCNIYEEAKQIWMREVNFGSTDLTRTTRESDWQKASDALDKAYQEPVNR